MKIPRLTKSTIGVAIAFFLMGYGVAKVDTPVIPLTTHQTVVSTPFVTPEGTAPSESALVTRVIDGDTIELSDGTKVRYIGINAPESTTKTQCFGKESSQENKLLVEGKSVRLEKDISNTDKYGRLLRYVWIGQDMINELLIRQGFAQIATYPPDVKYKDRFIEAERLAREENKGLWSGCPLPTAKNTVGK
jgi:micrococcal nuclease